MKETAKLKTISEMFDIPLVTLRIWASKRLFPGIIKKDRSIYVNVKVFRDWWIENSEEEQTDQ